MQREELVTYLQEKFGDKIELLEAGAYDPLFLLKNNSDLVEFCRELRDDETLHVEYLCNMSGVDTKEKFEVIYNCASYKHKHRFDFKIVMDYDGANFDTVLEIWPAANWYEREIWELYGIIVNNHPNLKRFLLPDDWDKGYPLRKDWEPPEDFITMPEV